MKLIEAKQQNEITIFDLPELAEYGKYAGKRYVGYIDVSKTAITTLKGLPKSVTDNFDCDTTNITSLEGAPRTVGGDFNCYNTKITSLEGAPESVGGYVDCSETEITSLEGAPRTIGTAFHFYNTQITSLHGINNYVKQAKEIQFGRIGYPDITHLLGLFYIHGLTTVIYNPNTDIEKIINMHLQSGDIFTCQDDLIEAGFIEQAKL